MAQGPLPENRRDLAHILKNNEFNILVAADEIVSILNLDEERYESVTFLLRKNQNNIRKSKKNVDQLNTEWWNSAIPWEPKSTKTPSNSSTLVSLDSNVRNNLFSIRLQQQRVRLSSILELIRETNSGYGLKCFSEEGTESCNKLIRKYRESLSRKSSFEGNIIDVFVRLVSQSDPVLVGYERCGQSGHTVRTKCCRVENQNSSSILNIDNLISSLIILQI